MNLVNIVKNAPEGADHYREIGGAVYYYRKSSFSLQYYHNGWWIEVRERIEVQKLPTTKLKTEYRKVEDSIWDLRPYFEAGELYRKLSSGEYKVILDIQTLAEALSRDACFYLSKTIIDEREEFNSKMHSAWMEWNESGRPMGDFLFDKGCRFID